VNRAVADLQEAESVGVKKRDAETRTPFRFLYPYVNIKNIPDFIAGVMAV
jgi:hypothetical protein